MGITSTVTVVNKSGKVVKTSKHLNSIFQEARIAYLEKKAEIKSARDDDFERRLARIEASDAGRSTNASRSNAMTTRRHGEHDRERRRDHESGRRRRSNPSSAQVSRRPSYDRTDTQRSSKKPSKSTRAPPPPTIERGYSDSFYENERAPQALAKTKTAPLTAANLELVTASSSSSVAPPARVPGSVSSSTATAERAAEITRRHSESDVITNKNNSTLGSSTVRPESPVDPSLAYGDLPDMEMPPPLPIRHKPEELELREKVTGLQRVLEEADCVQHSVQAVMKKLEEDPDAMAAVALTLAEISSLVTKMGPVALTALRSSAPMVVALLLSPEFLIAGGVALGVTVVSFGGYKIIKRLKGAKAAKSLQANGGSGGGSPAEPEEIDIDPQQELEELSQISRIEQWRRGIAFDPDTASIGTSVEGEFATPEVSKRLREEGVLAEKEKPSKTAVTTADKKDREKSSKTIVMTTTAEKKQIEKDKKHKEKELEKDKKQHEKQEKKEKKEREKTAAKPPVQSQSPSTQIPHSAQEFQTQAVATATAIKALFKKDKGEVVP